MNKATLVLQTANIPGVGRFGTLYSHIGKIICRTAEREYKNNEPNDSAIPLGRYKLIWRDSPSQGRRLHLENLNVGVSHDGTADNAIRSYPMFHVANFPHEVEDCIAPGSAFHKSAWGVSNSAEALNKLEKLVEILEAYTGEMPDLDII